MIRFGSALRVIAALLIVTLLMQSSGIAVAANASANWDAIHTSAPLLQHAASASPIPASVMRLTQHIRPVVIGQGIPGRPPVRTLRAVFGAGAVRTPSRHTSAARSALSVTTSSANTTGINRYWTYEKAPIPGLGTYMVNVASGNLLVQADDVDVPERGIDLAFRRTYNSNSQRGWTQNGSLSDGSPTPGQYGNGWSSSFDTHLALNSSGGITVFDVDGERIDFAPGTGNCLTPPAGQYTQLCWDGSAGYYWTKKNGTRYHYWTPDRTNLPASQSAYAGRLAEIEARNRNNSITLTYTWTNGDSSNSYNLHSIVATHSDGQTLTLNFGVVNITASGSFKLLTSVVRPDGVTITYAYDQYNNLTAVTEPSNGSSNSTQDYGYYGSSSQMNWAAGPRWTAGTWGQDGGYLEFGFSGTEVNFIGDVGIVNFTPSDGTNALLQPGKPTGEQTFAHENFTYLSGETQVTDTDGHATNWFYDNAGRVTKTQQWTGAPNNLWLTSYQSWDSNDNLVASLDPRSSSASDPAYQTDFAYDGNGNTVAVAQPAVSVSVDGILETIHPTALYAYDANNNVISSCDPQTNAEHARNWSGSGTPPACPSTAGSGAALFAWTAQTYEPNGELTSMTTPLGYTRSISYAPAAQGGTDYGLPTEVTGAGYTQQDGSTVTPDQKFEYDGYGNLVCYAKLTDSATHWYRLRYDPVNRMTALVDPDDASLTVSQCTNTAGLSGSHIAFATTYYADGAVQSRQTPAEYAKGVSTAFSYDPDGDPVAQVNHYGNKAGTTQYWYDGFDRLVETAAPHDPTDVYSFQWLRRYVYDLSQGGTQNVGGASFRAYGNLFEIEEYAGGSGSGVTNPPVWESAKAVAYDGLDRNVGDYVNRLSAWHGSTFSYDQSSATRGLLSSTKNPLGATASYNYNQDGAVTGVQFAGDGGVTPAKAFGYDADGRATSVSLSSVGAETYAFDQDGRLVSAAEPSQGLTSPAVLTYHYYADGTRSSIDVQSSGLTQQALKTYDYRGDGLLSRENVNLNGKIYGFTWQYTPGGRETLRSDPYYAQSQAPTYDASGQIATWIDPVGPTTAVQHDAEGDLTSYTAYGYTFTNTYNIRGEVVSATNSDVTCNYLRGASSMFPWGAQHSANGYMVQEVDSCNQPNEAFTFGWDPLTGIGTNSSMHDPSSTLYPKSSSSTTYDSAGRETYSYSSMTPCSNLKLYSGSITKTYDAQDLLLGTVLSTYPTKMDCTRAGDYANQESVSYAFTWGPNGHPVKEQYTTAASGPSATPPPLSSGSARTLHWDGDSLLFTSDPNGVVDDIKIGDFADIFPVAQTNSGLQMVERAVDGEIDDQLQGPGVTHGASPYGITQWYNYYSTTTGYTANPLLWLYRPDMVSDGINTIQGVRSVDTASMQWTSPDGFAGTADSLLSQKPYAYEGNNPFTNSDPSGYCTHADGTSDGKPNLCTIATVTSHCPDCQARRAALAQAALHDIDTTMQIGGVGLVLTDLAGGEDGAEFGALEEASQVAQRAASRVNAFSVPLKHLYGSAGRHSKFAKGTDPLKLIERALTSPNARFYPNSEGGFKVEADMGEVIGTKGQTGLRVIVWPDGGIGTAFPVNP